MDRARQGLKGGATIFAKASAVCAEFEQYGF
jgi:hypothetical protein